MTCGILFYMSLSHYLTFSVYDAAFKTSAKAPLCAIIWASLTLLEP